MPRHGLPRPLINAGVPDVPGVPEVDFLYPRVRVVVEADRGRFHGTAFARESDARKQARLEAAGYRVLRVTWHQVTRRQRETAARLRRAGHDS